MSPKRPGVHSGVYVDETVRHSAIARRVAERLGIEPVVLPEGEKPPAREPGQAPALHLVRYKGRFTRFCPGTSNYVCCGYRILHVGEGCPLDCAYCILNAYFTDSTIKVWANMDELYEAVERDWTAPGRRFRAGTGEFADSLALEHMTGQAADLVAFLSDKPSIVLELKTKTAVTTWMDAATDPRRILPAWSVNAPEIIEKYELGAATLQERLAAARHCAQAGFRVCLHFDPIIRFDGWERGYAQACEMIGEFLKPEQIAYVSLGSFRFMPPLKKVIQAARPDADFIHQEYVPGLDNKMRLLRPLRLAMFRHVIRGLRRIGLDEQLYFCMESPQIWKAALGRLPGNLNQRLLDLAFLCAQDTLGSGKTLG